MNLLTYLDRVLFVGLPYTAISVRGASLQPLRVADVHLFQPFLAISGEPHSLLGDGAFHYGILTVLLGHLSAFRCRGRCWHGTAGRCGFIS